MGVLKPEKTHHIMAKTSDVGNKINYGNIVVSAVVTVAVRESLTVYTHQLMLFVPQGLIRFMVYAKNNITVSAY